MIRWVSPPVLDGRTSNGWYPRLSWPTVTFGNVDANQLHIPSGVVTKIPGMAHLEPSPPRTFVPSPIIPGADWTGQSELVSGPSGEPWVWTQVAGGHNEQVFLHGRPDLSPSAHALIVEMPCEYFQVQWHEDAGWILAGMAKGNHGTPDYQDGQLHVVWNLPADAPRTALTDHLTRFAYPIRLPDVIKADVWTFGTTPNRQGIGLWPDGTPWLDFTKPLVGVWTSPWDAAQGLKAYPDEASLLTLLDAYQVPHIAPAVVALYRQERAAGGWNFDAIEEAIAVAVCQQTGCSLTLYDDHGLEDVDGQGVTYRFSLRERAKRLRDQGIGVVCGVRVYPDGQAAWSLEEAAQALMADGFPVTFTLALYTQAGNWPMTSVARRLQEMVTIGERIGVLGYDVFGVGRGGEIAEWQIWADRWLSTLLARSLPSRSWPRSTVIDRTPPVVIRTPPVVISGKLKDKPDKHQEIATASIGIGALVAVLIRWWPWKKKHKEAA